MIYDRRDHAADAAQRANQIAELRLRQIAELHKEIDELKANVAALEEEKARGNEQYQTAV